MGHCLVQRGRAVRLRAAPQGLQRRCWRNHQLLQLAALREVQLPACTALQGEDLVVGAGVVATTEACREALPDVLANASPRSQQPFGEWAMILERRGKGRALGG